MTTLFIIAAPISFLIILGVWWYIFFGQPNPPLSRTNISIASSSTPIVGAAQSIGTVSSSEAMDDSTGTDIANPPLPAEPLDIASAQFSVELASTIVEQTRGLSYRTSLGENDGMLFIFSTGTIQTFWMKDMNFPLDMIWISGNTVDGFAQNVPAPAPGTQLWELPIVTSPANTDKVLEVNAGTVAKYNIKVGDTVTIGAGQ